MKQLSLAMQIKTIHDEALHYVSYLLTTNIGYDRQSQKYVLLFICRGKFTDNIHANQISNMDKFTMDKDYRVAMYEEANAEIVGDR